MRFARGPLFALLTLSAFLTAACSTAPPPTLPGVAASLSSTVVVLVPGITGSQLRDDETGRIAWGTAARLVSPHDGGRGLALPIRPGDTARALSAFDVLEDIALPLGVWKKNVYGPIRRLAEANGLTAGNLLAPRAEASFFSFPYDWRQDNVAAARELAARLEMLRALKGVETLHVVLLCQSNGAHICRYLAKYGGATLEEAEAGRAAPPGFVINKGLAIDKVVLVGSSNAGSLRILREMNRGRGYIAWVGRNWQPETLLTLPALYQDLPFDSSTLFVGERGQTLDVDLYDPASWLRYGWSIWGETAAARLAREPFELLGTEEERRAFLARTLDRARRFHHLLAQDAPGFGPTRDGRPRYYLVQSLDEPTPGKALLIERNGRWRTLFTGDAWLKRRPDLAAQITAQGDGHASAESQLALSPQEKAALAEEPTYVHGPHFEMILERETLLRLLEILAGRGE